MMILLAAAAFLATPVDGPAVDPQFGAATRQNFAAMIVPPAPRGLSIEGTSGAAAVDAIRRLEFRKSPTLKNTAVSPALVWER